MAEGFSGWDATALSGDQKLYFWNAGVAGTTPRVWYYFLRDADPGRNRFSAIVIGLDRYVDEDQYDSLQNRILDLNYVVGRLRIGDIPDFAWSLRSEENKRAALAGASFKGSVLRHDLHEFLEDIPGRVKITKEAREHGPLYSRNYEGRVESLHGLTADWGKRQLFFPPGVDAENQASITGQLMPLLPPQTGEVTRYRMRWLGRILADYRNSSTRIVFIELPRGPLRAPDRNAPTAFINYARTWKNVTVADPETFRDLETPETFFDSLHVNRKGRAILSERLAKKVQAILSRP